MNDPSLKMLIIGISCILMWNASMTAYNELLNLSQTFSGITLQSKQTKLKQSDHDQATCGVGSIL